MSTDQPQSASQPHTVEESLIFKQRKSRDDDAEMDITPMIDITFLLLIFFLVAANLEEAVKVDLPAAKYGQAPSMKKAVVLTIAKAEEDAPIIYKASRKQEDAKLVSADPQDQEKEIVDFIEKQMLDDSTKEYVMIMAEVGVKERHVARVARAVGIAAPGKQLYIAVFEGKR